MRFHARTASTTWGFDSREDRPDMWREKAACRRPAVDPELFFNDGHGAMSAGAIDKAKTVCRVCPVLPECFNWVSRYPQEFGIWAGLTPLERRGRRQPEPRPRYCQRCREAYQWDARHPHARICPACAVTRERFHTRIDRPRRASMKGATA